MKALADTCFLIDWIGYKRKNIIKQIFEEIIILSEVEKEIFDDNLKKVLRNWAIEGFVKFRKASNKDINDAIKLTTDTWLSSIIGQIHYTEALILAHAKNTGIKKVISENYAVIYLPKHLKSYEIEILTAGDLLIEAAKKKIISKEKFQEILKEYQIQTKKRYSL